MKTEIKILHAACCAASSPIRKHIESIAEKYNKEVTITEFTELQDVMGYGTTSFPSLVINGKVYNYKRVHKEEQLAQLI